jgi:pilus assembly protein CpaB
VSSRRTLILIAAIAVGIFAGVALLNYVRGVERDVYNEAEPTDVLIATADIPEGTSAADALDSIEVSQIPLKIRPTTYIAPAATDSIAGLVARSDIPKNQIIVAGLFVDPTVVSLRFTDQVPAGQVAISVQVSQVRAVGGYLQPGDQVNMMIVHENLGCGAEEDPDAEGADTDGIDGGFESGLETVAEEEYCTFQQPARYLFQQVEILAIGARQQLAAGQTSETAITPQGGTITFMVPNQAAQLLASVSPDSVYLTLLPDGYEAEPLKALTLDLMEGPTPAEIAGCLTPYGPDAYVEGDSTTVADDADEGSHWSCEELWGE